MTRSILLLFSLCFFASSCQTEPSTQLEDYFSKGGVAYKVFSWEGHTGMCAPIASFPPEKEPSLLVPVPANSAFQPSASQLLILWDEAPMREMLVHHGTPQAYKSEQVTFQHAFVQLRSGELCYIYTVDGTSLTSFAADLVEYGAEEAIGLPTGIGPNYVRYAHAPFEVQKTALSLPNDEMLFVGLFERK